MKIFKRTIIVIGATVLLALAVLYFILRGTLPPTRGEQIVAVGLKGPVTIQRNRFGIPDIQCDSLHDLLYSIGFLHASDRLFQMDLSRRDATGRLAEIFGTRALSHDRKQHEIGINESINKELKKLPVSLKNLLRNYCRGINDYIRRHPLPLEFTLLGYRPRDWEIRDSIAIMKNMQIILEGSGSELYHQSLRQALGDEAFHLLFKYRFASPGIIEETELDSAYKDPLFTTFLEGEQAVDDRQVGSNSWVLAGTRTYSQKPLLANDPHLPGVFPSYFYQLRARFRDHALCGNTLPGFPFIIIGRNQQLAWGFTNVGNDVIDYGILTVNPRDENQYLVDGRWVNFTYQTHRIAIKTKEPEMVKTRQSIFGPVFKMGDRFLVRHAMFLYPTTTAEACYRMNMAGDIRSFLKGLALFNSPGQNVVFADTAGNIGYYPTGRLPRRLLGDGSLPVRVTRSQGLWDGFHPENEKPVLINPPKGYIITANNPVFPGERRNRFAVTWHPSFRAHRIKEMIRDRTGITVEETTRMQGDCRLVSARFLLDTIPRLPASSLECREVLDRLRGWDCRARGGVEPALFYHFQHYLATAIFEDDLSDPKYRNLIRGNLLYRLLKFPVFDPQSPALKFFSDDRRTPATESYGDMVQRALKQTHRQWTADGKKLNWEGLHRLTYRHPLGSVFPLGFLNRGPYFMPGGNGAVLATNFFLRNPFQIRQLPTFRMVIDLADFSRSLLIHSSGQSGNFMSPHYHDQIALYTGLKYRKMEDFSGSQKILRLILAEKSATR